MQRGGKTRGGRKKTEVRGPGDSSVALGGPARSEIPLPLQGKEMPCARRRRQERRVMGKGERSHMGERSLNGKRKTRPNLLKSFNLIERNTRRKKLGKPYQRS